MGLGVHERLQSPNALFNQTVHGVLGEITPSTHPHVSALPEELQVGYSHPSHASAADFAGLTLWKVHYKLMFVMFAHLRQYTLRE